VPAGTGVVICHFPGKVYWVFFYNVSELKPNIDIALAFLINSERLFYVRIKSK
jgi:hypothetical protein